MCILIAWDDPKEAEVLRLYLSVGDNAVDVSQTVDGVLPWARQGPWDVMLLALTFPAGAGEAFPGFTRLRQKLPGVPVVLACRPAEMIHLPRFLNHGLRFHIVRDDQADFGFLVLSSLESAVAAARAENSQKQLEKLKNYLGE
jgi:DNA-binding response OmpR family regulator